MHCKGKMKGCIGFSSWSWPMKVISDVPVSRNDIKLCQNYMKIHIYTILYRNSRFKQIIFSKYATNLKTKISQRNLIVTLFYNNTDLQIILSIISNKNKNKNYKVIIEENLSYNYYFLALILSMIRTIRHLC